MATITAVDAVFETQDDVEDGNTYGTSTDISSIAQHSSNDEQLVITTDSSHGISTGDWIAVEGYPGYNGIYIVEGTSSTTLNIRAEFQSDLASSSSGTVREVTHNDAYSVRTSGTMTIGDNNTSVSRVIHRSPKMIRLQHQIRMYENPDNTPALDIGSPEYPTMILASYSAGSWPNGGVFRGEGSGTNPVIRLTRCNFTYLPRVRNSAFGGNLMEIIVEAENCNFSWLYDRAVPFFGNNGIFRNCVFYGATGNLPTSSDQSFFLANPRVFENCVIERWGVGLKLEYGTAFWGSVEFINCGAEAFVSRSYQGSGGAGSGTLSGFTDGAMNLVDSIFSLDLCGFAYEGIMDIWRTVRTTAKDVDGTAIQGAKLFYQDTAPTTPVERKYSLECQARVRVTSDETYLESRDTVINLIDDASELMYRFRPGETVAVTGSSTAGNNLTANVTGAEFTEGSGEFFAHNSRLYLDEAFTTNETSDSTYTIEKQPPESDADGDLQDLLVQVFHAQAKQYGDNSWYESGTRDSILISEAIDNLDAIQDGTGTWAGRVESDAFHRTSWRLVMVPPYPYGIATLDVSLDLNESGEPFSWNPLLSEDPLITETDPDVVAAYTTLETAAKMYDYLEYWKREDGNEEYPRHDIRMAIRNGTVLDFGELDVTLSIDATDVLSVTTDSNGVQTGVTLKTGTNFDGGIQTDGTVTVPSALRITGSVADSTGIDIIVGGFSAAHRSACGAWPSSQGTTDRSNIITAANFETRNDVTLSVNGLTISLDTDGADFRKYGTGTKLIMSGWTNDANNAEADIDTISGDGTSCTLTRTSSGSFVSEAPGNDIDIEDGDATTIRLRLARNTSYYLVTDAVSYLRSSALLIDTGIISSVTGALRRIVDTAGDDLVPSDSDLTANEREQLKLIEYDVDDDIIRFGASSSVNEYTFGPVARAIEIGQSSPSALADPYIITLREGSFTIENDSDRTIERAANVDTSLVPDLSEFQVTKIGSTDQKDFVDYSKGAIIVQSSSPAVVSVVVDEVDIPQDNFDERMAGVPASTKDDYKSDASLQAIGASIFGDSFQGTWAAGTFAVGDVAWHSDRFYECTVARTSSNTDNPATDTASWDVAQVTASGGGGGAIDQTTFNTRMENVPSSVKNTYKAASVSFDQSTFDERMAAVPSATKDGYKSDVSILENTTHGLAALKTLLDAIPTDNPTVPTTTQIVTAIQAADFEDGDGTQTLAQVLAAIKDVVDDIPTTITFPDTDDANAVATEVLRLLRTETADGASGSGSGATDSWLHIIRGIETAVDAIPTDVMDQTTFNTRMSNVSSAIKNTYKATTFSGTVSLDSSSNAAIATAVLNAFDIDARTSTTNPGDFVQRIREIKTAIDDIPTDDSIQIVGSSIFGDKFQGIWAAGTFEVNDVVWHSDTNTDKFYRCTAARDSNDTDDPAADTASWSVVQILSERVSDAIRDLEVIEDSDGDNDINLLKALKILLSIVLGEIKTSGSNLKVYTPDPGGATEAGESDDNLVATIPQITASDNRPAGSTIPSDS